jgi:hypothetical protein
MTASKNIKPIPDSLNAYAELKPITDDAQAGTLNRWSPAVIDLLASYKVNIQRLKDVKAQANLSFPTSITDNKSMAIGFRYAKDDGSFAEDLFVFEENVGLTCYYRGTQEEALPEYAGTHHATIVLSEFLPDFQRELADMRQQIDAIKATSGVELITDEMHLQAMQDVQHQFNEQVQSFAVAHGNSSSAVQQYSRVVQIEATKKRQALQAKKALSDRAYPPAPIPEIALMIRAQANTNRFEVQISNNSNQALVAENIQIDGTDTPLSQQFDKLFPIEQVNIPEGVFDNKLDGVSVVVRYRTLDGKKYELTQIGEQEYRNGDSRYNVIFPSPSSIRTI